MEEQKKIMIKLYNGIKNALKRIQNIIVHITI
jgi:hypothetical protein